MTLLGISLAGAVGCVLRYVLEYAVRRHHPVRRPWATVAANILGCAIAGWAAYRFVGVSDARTRTIVLTGLCGGLTTFSSALAIPALLYHEDHRLRAATLVVTTPLLCALAFVGGVALAH